MRVFSGFIFGAAVLAGGFQVHAETVSVAVAANFSAAAEHLAAAFKVKTDDDVLISAGATGALYTQVTQGAPFQVFLSADSKRPAQAVTEGFAVEGSAFSYAMGKLVLFSPSIDLADGEAVLTGGAFQHLAIADPATAPYGAAAFEVMTALGLDSVLQPKLVTGENIMQTLQFVESGNAELGFVALSQLIGREGGFQWLVPGELYSPIVQDAVLLKTGENNQAAKAFLEFLKSDEGKAIIEKYGYATGV
jgi:molybdate transport system substrate-binding protein